MNLVDGKEPTYEPIYSLRILELKTFKTYIETNLANSFINSFKSPTSALIFLFGSLIAAFAHMTIIEILKT